MAQFTGWLKKKSNNPLKPWDDRWFHVDGIAKSLKWFVKEGEKLQNSLDLTLVTSIESVEDKLSNCFVIKYTNNGKSDSYILSAVTDAERQNWINKLNEVVFPSKKASSSEAFVRDEDWSNLNCISVTLNATRLQKQSTFSKSDPFLVIKESNSGKVIYRSEVQTSTQEPKWDAFDLHLVKCGGPNGFIELGCWDFAENGKHEEIGSVVIEARQLAVPNSSFTLLKNSKSVGAVVVQSAKMIHSPPPMIAPAYEFTFSAKNFAKLDGPTGKSDPFFFVTDASNRVLYKSEVVMKSLEPVWKPFKLEGLTPDFWLNIYFYDWDDDGSRDYAGVVCCSVEDLLWNKVQIPIINPNKVVTLGYKNSGMLHVLKSQPCAPSQPVYLAPAYKIKCSGRKLASKDANGKSDPFLIVTFKNAVVYRSEVIPKNLNPNWREFSVPLPPGLTIDDKISFECFDEDKDGGHDFIGKSEISLRELFIQIPAEYPLLDKHAALGHSQPSAGALIIESVTALSQAPLQISPSAAYKITMRARKLDSKNKDFTSDPFFEVKAPVLNTNNKFITLYRSEVVKKDLNPTWNSFIFNVNMVGDIFKYFRIHVYDYSVKGEHESIGSLDLSFWDILLGSFPFPLVSTASTTNYLSAMRSRYPTAGTLFFDVEPANPKDIPPIPDAFLVECSGVKLAKKDLGSSDPYFTIRNDKGRILYKSEWIAKNLNPKWKPFKINVHHVGGLDTPLRVQVFDYDKDGSHDMIGELWTTLREWTFGSYQTALMNEGNSAGAFSIDKLTPTTADVDIKLPPAFLIKARASKLPKSDMTLRGGKSDPFFSIKYKATHLDSFTSPNTSTFLTMHRSEVIKGTINPDWKEFVLSVNLIGGSLDSVFDIEVFDWDKDGTHDLLGLCTTTLREWTFSWCELSLKSESGETGKGLFVIEKMIPLSEDDIRVAPVGWIVHASADKLARADGPFKKSDPFLEIKHKPPGFTKPVTIHRSNVVKSSLSPVWQPFELGVSIIGGLDEPFTIDVLDWDADGSHDVIGSVRTTLREISFGWYSSAIRHYGTAKGSFSIDKLEPVSALYHSPALRGPPGFKVWSSGMKLAKKDLGSSDPFFEIRWNSPTIRKEIVLYRSEVIRKNLNPKWREWELDLDLIGGIDSEFRVCVYDWDKDGGHDLIGELTTTAREWLFGSYQQGLTDEGSAKGAFSVDGVAFLESTKKKEVAIAYKLNCSAFKLERKDGPLGKSDPFFEVIAQPPGFTKPITLYRSEVIMKNLNPVWPKSFVINVADVHGIDTEFEFRVYDWDKDGTHDLIGRVRTTLRDLMFGSYQMALKHPDKEWRSGYESSGAFSVDEVSPVMAEHRPIVPVAYKVKCSGMKLDTKGLTGGSDPFFEIKAQPPGFSFPITLYRSEPVMKNSNPSWKPFDINLRDIHGLDTEFVIKAWNWRADGGHELIGEGNITFREWTFGAYSIPLKTHGSSSHGAFCLDWVQALDIEMVKEYPSAFLICPSGMKLEKKDGPLSKSDPFFEIKCKPPGFTKDITVHRSNVIMNDLNPKWNAFELAVETVRGLDTPFTVLCYDWDKDGGHDLIGKFETTLREWTFGPYQQALVNPRKVGNLGYTTSGAFSVDEVIPIAASEQKPIPPAYLIKPSGMKLAKKDLMSKSDPFFKIVATPPSLGYTVTLYRSEVVKNSSDPDWKPFVLNVADVRGLDTEFTIYCYDEDADGSHDLIGTCHTTLREWTFGPYQHALRKDSSSGSSGAFSVDSITPMGYEEVKRYPPAYTVKCKGNKISGGLLSKADPFFKVTATPPGFTQSITLYRSEVNHNTLAPDWKSFTLNVDDVRGLDSPFYIDVYDYNPDGDHKLIGSTNTSLRELTFGAMKMALKKDTSSSQGAFEVESITPLSKREIKQYPVAYSITASGNKLAKKDLLGVGKSDPFFKIIAIPPGFTAPITLFRSEMIKDTKAPKWNSFILNVEDVRGLDTQFEVQVFDWNSNGSHDLIGKCRTTLREWTFGPYSQGLHIGSSGSQGAFCVDSVTPLDGKQIKTYAPSYMVYPSAQKLEKKDGLLGKADPFFEVKFWPQGFDKKITLYRSEVIKQDLNPTWKPFELSVEMLGGLDKSFDVLCYDWNQNGHELIGQFTTTLREWTFGSIQTALVNPSKVGSLGYSSSGAFSVEKIEPLSATSMKQYPPAFEVKPSGAKLVAQKLLGKPNPYFEVFSQIPGQKQTKLYRSDVNTDTASPQWNPFVINLLDVGGLDCFFLIQCWDKLQNGTKELIGECRTTLREWTFGSYQEELNRPGRSDSAGAFSVDEVKPLPNYVPAAAVPPAYSLKLGARKLDVKDGLAISGSSDPFFRISHTVQGHTSPITLYRSEVVHKNLNPSWGAFTINVRDIGGIDVPFTIQIIDSDPEDGSHDTIGEVTVTLHELAFKWFEDAIIDPARRTKIGYSCSGTLFVESIKPLDAEEVRTYPAAYEIKASGIALAKADLLSKSDPFFEIRTDFPGYSEPLILYRSEVVKDNQSPSWTPFVLNIQDLGGLDKPFKIFVYDYDVDGSHSLIGSVSTTLREWTFGVYQEGLVNPSKVGRIGYETSGAFHVEQLKPLTDYEAKKYAAGYRVTVKGIKFDSKDGLLGKSDPFFVLQRVFPNYNAGPLTLYRSEVIKQNLSPEWTPFEVDPQLLGGLDSPFTIICYDWNEDGVNDEIGRFTTTLREWTFGSCTHRLINASKIGRIGYSSSGGFVMDKLEPIDAAKVKVFPPAYSFSAKGVKLDRKDGLLSGGKSDPFFVVKGRSVGFDSEVTLYRSEAVKDTLDPEWKPFHLSINQVGGLDTPFTIQVYDWDTDGSHDLVGQFTTTLREMSFSPLEFPLINPEKRGRIGYRSSGAFAITAAKNLTNEEIKTYAPAYMVHPAALKLAAKDSDGSSDPFFEVRRLFPGFSKPTLLYRSEVVKQALGPTWKPFELSLLMTGGLDTPFTVTVYDWNENGDHVEIGALTTTLREWTFPEFSEALLNKSQRGRSNYKSSGAFLVVKMEPLANETMKTIPIAYSIKTSAAKLDASEEVYFEVYVFTGKKADQLVYRSERMKDSNPSWVPFVLPVEYTKGIDSPVKIKCVEYKKGQTTTIGSLLTSLREISFGNFQLKLINKKKAKSSLRYHGSGAFSVVNMTPIYEPVLQPATGYTIRCMISDFAKTENGSPKDNTLRVYGMPLDTEFEQLIYRGIWDQSHSFTIHFPFEAVRSLDVKLTFKYHKGSFRATLRELASRGASFAFDMKKPGLFKPKFSGILEVQDVRPTNQYLKGYAFSLAGVNLDAKDDIGGKSDPFFMVSLVQPGSNAKTLLYSSETHPQNLNPEFKPFVLEVGYTGSWDATTLLVECWDFDQSGYHDLIGSFTTTLRQLAYNESFLLINDLKKAKLTSYICSGTMQVRAAEPVYSDVPVVPPYGLSLLQLLPVHRQ